MNKQSLVALIIKHLEQELDTALTASQQAHEAATHSENIAENKYDTLGLEASYLAHGQSMRISELQANLLAYKKMNILDFTDESAVSTGAWVTVEEQTSAEKRQYFIGLTGGFSVNNEQQKTQIISNHSPLAKTLIGKYIDDEVIFTHANSTQIFTITDIS